MCSLTSIKTNQHRGCCVHSRGGSGSLDRGGKEMKRRAKVRYIWEIESAKPVEGPDMREAEGEGSVQTNSQASGTSDWVDRVQSLSWRQRGQLEFLFRYFELFEMRRKKKNHQPLRPQNSYQAGRCGLEKSSAHTGRPQSHRKG